MVGQSTLFQVSSVSLCVKHLFSWVGGVHSWNLSFQTCYKVETCPLTNNGE